MSNGSKKRRRGERVVGFDLPPGSFARAVATVTKTEYLARIGACVAVALFLSCMMRAWVPPFAMRTGDVPDRDLHATERLYNEVATEEARREARAQARYVYRNDAAELTNIRSGLRNRVGVLLTAPEFDDGIAEIWSEFVTPRADGEPIPFEELKKGFEEFRAGFQVKPENMEESTAQSLQEFEKAVKESMIDFERTGLLRQLAQLPLDASRGRIGNESEIIVVTPGASFPEIVKVKDVRIGDAQEILREQLRAKIASPPVAAATYQWLVRQKLETLKLDVEATQKEKDLAAARVEPIYYPVGHLIGPAGEPLGIEELRMLKEEHEAMVAALPLRAKIMRFFAILGMFVAVFVLIGIFTFRHERRLVDDPRYFLTTLAVLAVSITLAILTSGDAWRAELIPLLLFSITMAIAWNQETALLLSAAANLIAVVALGQDLFDFVVLMSGSVTAVLFLGRVRHRNRLVYVGIAAGAVVFFTMVGISVLRDLPWTWSLAANAGRFALWAVIAGSLMEVLLPRVESLFGVLTDIRLFELGDAAHPLLQELVRRAPGTYNHSINVASLAEAAADSIGARGLLVRVGAYFHDIGKMLKPGYFVENQGQEGNRHDTLLPAMSTLIIVAHVKDGADLARQHHLPRAIIDFIQQHHGTTLVEYFYRMANKRREETEPDSDEIEEESFRYPGPKPQTKEAAVLMLSDAVESACRTLVDPAPSRIENLVEDIAMKRLLDGQFDECDLTLRELRTITDSLVKSLCAVYHGRVKYPERVPQPA